MRRWAAAAAAAMALSIGVVPARAGSEEGREVVATMSADGSVKSGTSLPVRVGIDYFLDGKKTPAADLKGKTGDVKIVVNVRNVTRDTQPITYTSSAGETVTRDTLVYVPIEYVMRAAFPGDSWTRIRAKEAAVESEGNKTVVLRPGLLAPPFGHAADEIVLEAHGEKILLPEIKISAAAATHPDAQQNVQESVASFRSLYGSLTTARGTLQQIYDGTLQIGDGLEKMRAGIGERDAATKEPEITLGPDGVPTTLLGALGFMRNALRDQVLPALGARDTQTGKPVVTLKSGVPTTVIGALGFTSESVRTKLLAAIGAIDQTTGRATSGAATLLGSMQASKDAYDKQLIPAMQAQLVPAVDGLKALSAAGAAVPGTPAEVLAIFGQMNAVINAVRFGLTNAEFTKPQPEIGGKVPFQYRIECAACFDPASAQFDTRMADSADPKKLAAKFTPGLTEVFQLFSTLTGAGMKALNTGDVSKPGLVEGLQLVAGGLDTLAGNLMTLDPKKPGLVEGLGQMRDGLTTVIGSVHTLDPAKPGVVDGLDLILAGLGKASQGLFAINELVVRSAQAGSGQAGDLGALEEAVLEAQVKAATNDTFVLTLDAQSTAARDNAMRGALIGLAGLALAMLGRRPRVIGAGSV